MADKKEIKILWGFAKEVVNKRIFKKLKVISDEKDKAEAIKYAVKTSLDLRYHELNQKIKEMEDKKQDVFFAKTKSNLLSLKLKLFAATFDEKDFKNALALFKEAEKEVKNV